MQMIGRMATLIIIKENATMELQIQKDTNHVLITTVKCSVPCNYFFLSSCIFHKDMKW